MPKDRYWCGQLTGEGLAPMQSGGLNVDQKVHPVIHTLKPPLWVDHYR